MTERDRFRVASHSKAFTAAGILKLKDEGRLRLDDCASSFVSGLNPRVASVTVGQLLSHSAGLTRDGPNGGQFSDQRPFLSKDELLGELGDPHPIEAGVRYKYSNHGFWLLGLIVEAVTLEPYDAWIMREIIGAAGLAETTPDMPADGRKSFARAYGASPVRTPRRHSRRQQNQRHDAGDGVRRVRDRNGTVTEIWIGGSRLLSEEALKSEILTRYGAGEQ